MGAIPDKTVELQASDLASTPPLPPPFTPPLASDSDGREPVARRTTLELVRATSIYRKPFRRLLKAYLVTTQVIVSYAWVTFRRRLVSEDTAAQLVEAAHRRNARRVEAAIVALQGLFIKVGQLISIMANFLPEAFRRELQGLQDQVPPRAYPEIEARLREEFGGRAPDEVFASFEREPIASASIGQVHVGRLRTGEKVAVKVQYPDIETIVRTDLRALKRIFGVLRRLVPDWGLDTIYREIREMVIAELDYRREAEAIKTISAHFAGREDVLFPRVMAEYSTGRVLTTEWMAGIKAADGAKIAALGIDRRKAARLCVEAYCQQIFIDGIYHADPHPGNLLLRPLVPGSDEPAIVFLDFGATAQVSPAMRKGMVSFLQGTMTRDTARIVAAMKEMGFISRRADPEVFDRVVEYFHDKFRSQVRIDGFSLKDIRLDAGDKIASLLDLRELNVSLSDLRDAFHVPKEWILLERTLLLLLGVCTELDPEMNPMGVIQPYVTKFLLGEKKEWSEAVIEAARDATLGALALPGEIGRFVTIATRGDLEFRVRYLDEHVGVLYALGQQVLWGFLGVASLAFSIVFDGRGQGSAALICEVATGGFGALLLMALLRGRRAGTRRRR